VADHRCKVEYDPQGLSRPRQRQGSGFDSVFFRSPRCVSFAASPGVSPGYRNPSNIGYARDNINKDSGPPTIMNCPACSSDDVRTSQSSRWNDFFQRVRGREVFRCRSCRKRFYSSTPIGDGTNTANRRKKRLRRQLLVIAIFVVAFMIFWYFLRYITAEKDAPSESGAARFPVTHSLA